jgi:hypothetical protein
MTRRRLFARRPLSMQQYIHRATVGLPKTERLDVAAELRTHLVERVNALRAEGHSTEEAEYLAVQAMGDPAPTNRGLLGHAFTHRVGWLALGAVLLGGGGWAGYRYAEREWMPPREGLNFYNALTLEDLQRLNSSADAPREDYQGVTITYPLKTQTIYYALFTPIDVEVKQKNVSAELSKNMSNSNLVTLPGSYRYQERWLVASIKGYKNCGNFWSFYTKSDVIRSRFMGTASFGMPQFTLCSGLARQYTPATSSLTSSASAKHPVELYPNRYTIGGYSKPLPISLNHWTIVSQLVLNPRTSTDGRADLPGKVAGMYIAIMPTDQAGRKEENWGYDRNKDGSVSNLRFGGLPLPTLPRLDLKHDMFYPAQP